VGELANASALAVPEDPELAILLARQAVDVTRSVGEPVLPQATAALQYAVQSSRLELRTDGAAFSLDASRDGSTLATGSLDQGATEIRDPTTLDVITTMPNPPGHIVNDVEVSPDGRLVATAFGPNGDAEQTVAAIVWDVPTGDEIARLTGPPGYYVASFSPDGRLLATSHDVAIEVWDISSSTQVSTFQPEGGSAWSRFLTDGSLLVPALDRDQVGVYAIDGSRLDVIPTPGFAANNSIAVDPTGNLVALASQSDHLVQVRDLRTHELVRSIPVADVGGPEWSPDGTQLAIPSGNLSDIRIVDLATGTDSFVLRGHESGVTDVAFLSPERLASVGWEGGLRVWDVSPDGPQALGALRSTIGNPADIQVSPDGSEVAVVSWTGGYQVFDAATGATRRAFGGQLGEFAGRTPSSPDWHYVASVDAADGTGNVRDMASLAPVRELPACAGAIGFSHDSSLLVLDGSRPCDRERYPQGFPVPPEADRRSRVIEVESGRVVLDLGELPVWHAAFNAGGPFEPDRFLAVNMDLTEIEIYDMRERKLIATLTEDDFGNGLPVAMSFDPDGTLLAGSLNTGTAFVVDLAKLDSGAPTEEAMVFRQTVHNGATDATMGPHGLLATAAGDSRVRLWDVKSGALLLDLRNNLGSDCCRRVAFSPSGEYLYYTDAADIVRRLPLDVDELVELADSRVTRELTADECQQYVDPDGC
jgi:WD40 repeat protein